MPDPQPFAVYAHISTPVVVTDADYCICYANPSAERFWGTSAAAMQGRHPMDALRLLPPDGQDAERWVDEVGLPAVASGDPLACLMQDAVGRAQPIRLNVTRLRYGEEWFAVLSVLIGEQGATPTWALTDPLTGLYNRHQWEREFPERSSRGGAIVFLDVDNLKRLNHLNGHRRGDQALIRTAACIRDHLPVGAIAVRYGGDEFVLVLPGADAAAARATAAAILAQATGAADVPLSLNCGIAAYGPGGLAEALVRADEAMCEDRGVLPRGQQGAPILRPREARGSFASPGGGPQRHGEFARGFGVEFDAYFRQMFARSVAQAREFVEFVGPAAGANVLEVGAGSGRIAFDGGLAGRIGPEGQLLLTDASAAQLQVARERAASDGFPWVRFLVTPVEDVPVASGTVDLVLGALFLHFTDAPAAIRSMARLVRPGGRVALLAGEEETWGPVWERAFAPIFAAQRAQGNPPSQVFLPRAAVEALFTANGLVVEQVQSNDVEQVAFPSADIALAVARQGRLVALCARGLPAEATFGLEEAVEREMRLAFAELGPTVASVGARSLFLLARRPG